MSRHGHEVPWHRVVQSTGAPDPASPEEALRRLRRDRTDARRQGGHAAGPMEREIETMAEDVLDCTAGRWQSSGGGCTRSASTSGAARRRARTGRCATWSTTWWPSSCGCRRRLREPRPRATWRRSRITRRLRTSPRGRCARGWCRPRRRGRVCLHRVDARLRASDRTMGRGPRRTIGRTASMRPSSITRPAWRPWSRVASTGSPQFAGAVSLIDRTREPERWAPRTSGWHGRPGSPGPRPTGWRSWRHRRRARGLGGDADASPDRRRPCGRLDASRRPGSTRYRRERGGRPGAAGRCRRRPRHTHSTRSGRARSSTGRTDRGPQPAVRGLRADQGPDRCHR